MTPVVIAGLLVKVTGAIFGAALALIFVPPRTLTGFIRRLTASIIGGTVFAPYVREYAGFDMDWEGLLGAACLAAFLSWSMMGVIIRLLRAWEASKYANRDIDGQTD
jgi:hypothetical protein